MVATPHKPSYARKLESAESLAILQDQLLDPRRSTSSGTNDSGGDTCDNATVTGVQVSIHRGRLAVVAGLTIVVLVAGTLIFSHGVELHQSDKSHLGTKQQQDLLEKYNSYKGTTAAAIERLLSLATPIDREALAGRSNPFLRICTLGLSAGFGYLLTNGLSALNVEVRELPVKAVISTQDLSRQLNQSGTSSMAVSYPDYRPRNPVGNTILRNRLLPTVLPSNPICEGSGSMDTLDSVTFGFPQVPWMQNLLTESLDATTMMIAVGSNDDAVANKALTPDQFPMNASTAADLLLYGVAAGSMYSFFNIFSNTSRTGTSQDAPAARLARLISPDASASETVDREWFLAHSPQFVVNITSSAAQNRSSLRNWTLELTRVPITDSIWMDAVTIEREMASAHLETARSKDGMTRYFSTERVSTGSHIPVPTGNETTDAMIESYAICVNNHGEESLTATIEQGQDLRIVCTNKSSSSLFLLSSTKWLVADALISDTFANASVEGGCLGLDAPLPSSRQRLVVGATSLPVAQLSLLEFDMFWVQQPVSIVSITRPKNFHIRNGGNYDGWLGDFLLPHNVHDMSRVNESIGASSSAATECISKNYQRLATYVDNHLFMDSTLQTTYTAAAFFVFQNGVALDNVIKSNTLAFSQNVEQVVLRAYIPRLNVWLTLIGCGLLGGALVAVVSWKLWSPHQSDPLELVSTLHAIARVMTNNTANPSVLLQRTVVHDPSAAEDEKKESTSDHDVDAWMIQSIKLQPKTEGGKENDKQGAGAGQV